MGGCVSLHRILRRVLLETVLLTKGPYFGKGWGGGGGGVMGGPDLTPSPHPRYSIKVEKSKIGAVRLGIFLDGLTPPLSRAKHD